MLSFVAWEVALFEKCMLCIWFWMLTWINTKLLLSLLRTMKDP